MVLLVLLLLVVAVVVSMGADRQLCLEASATERNRTGSLGPAFLDVRDWKTRKNNDGDDDGSRDGSRLIALWPSRDQCQSGEGQGAFPPRIVLLVGPTPMVADMRKHSPLLLNGASTEYILKGYIPRSGKQVD